MFPMVGRHRCHRSIVVGAILVAAHGSIHHTIVAGFSLRSPSRQTWSTTGRCGDVLRPPCVVLSAMPRYGPPLEQSNQEGEERISLEESSANLAAKKRAIQEILTRIDSVSDPQHIPSLLTRNIDTLLSVMDDDGLALMSTIVDEARIEHGEDAASRMEDILDLVLSFTEQFVEEAGSMQNTHRQLLGRIIMNMSNQSSGNNRRRMGYDREDALNQLFADERDNLTAGFLRHLESECERIANAPSMTPESSRLLETLRVIQARVLEELGKELGAAAQVLGQLVSYETSGQRLAVLDAGLAVQGVDFAREMRGLTEEALEGFARIPNGADPELTQRITEIHERLGRFLGSVPSTDAFQ